MTILYEYTAGTAPHNTMATIFFIISGLFFMAGCGFAVGIKDIKVFFCGFLMAVVFAAMGIRLTQDYRQPRVKALLDNTIPYTEVVENYRYVSHEGDIWTFEVLNKENIEK